MSTLILFFIFSPVDFCDCSLSTLNKKYHNATPKLSAEIIYVDILSVACIYVEKKIGADVTKQTSSRSSPLNVSNVDLSQKVLQKQEFGRRLYGLMMEKPWTQSDLARAAGLGRDSISQYVRGKSVPTPQNLQKLAKALDIDPDVLFPNYAAHAAMVEEPTFQVKAVDGSASEMWLVVNMKVTSEKAMKVMAILNEK